MKGSALLNQLQAGLRIDAADARLISWLCERAGLNENAPATAPFLCTVAALCHACAEGSLCLSLEPAALTDSLRELLSALETETDYGPDTLARAFHLEVAAGSYRSALGSASEPGPLIAHQGLLFFHRHFMAEKTLAEDVRARLRAPLFENQSGPGNPEKIRSVLEEVFADIPLTLTRRQKWALYASLRSRVFILSGGPGTGKTTWIASWLLALRKLNPVGRVRLCAPTGRAAQRLQESLRNSNAAPDASVETLHTLLAYQPYSGRFARTADDPLDADWVLLDEASMADAFLLAALVKALPPTAGLVLVGDPDQLPSVEAGSVLRELLPDDGAAELSEETWNTLNTLFPEDAPVPGEKRAATGLPPSVTLNESRRATGDILHLASAIKTGEEEKVLGVLGDPLPLAEAFSSAAPVARLFAPAEDFARALPDLLEAYADALFLKRRVRGKTYGEWLDTFRTAPATEEEALLPILWEFHTAARILAPARRGPLSAERVNRLLSARLEPLFSLRGEDGRGAFHGAPVLITRNDARTGLANGESGLWLHSGKSGSRGLQAYFPRPGCWLRLPAALLPAFETGFASTVHKSQGSEYNLALLVLPEAGNRLLARETLYTGVTRARDRVLIFASEASLREAARHLLRRDSGLRGWFT